MRISILIPWRTDGGHRERLWAHLGPLWEPLPYEVCVAADGCERGQPFNYATAANAAAAMATGEVLITWGADQIPDTEAIEAAARIAAAHGWAQVFTETGYYSRADTARILAGISAEGLALEYTEPHCTGLIAVRRDAWDAAGGMDERFTGWGYEDAALRDRLAQLYGPPSMVRRGTLRCLWHGTSHHVYEGPNAELYYGEYAKQERPR